MEQLRVEQDFSAAEDDGGSRNQNFRNFESLNFQFWLFSHLFRGNFDSDDATPLSEKMNLNEIILFDRLKFNWQNFLYLFLFLFKISTIWVCCVRSIFSLTGFTQFFQFSPIIKCCCRQDYSHCDAAPEEDISNHIKTTLNMSQNIAEVRHENGIFRIGLVIPRSDFDETPK